MRVFEKNKKIFVILALFLFLLPTKAKADTLLEKREFSASQFYITGLAEDADKRTKITATLQTITDQFYFYIESKWWDSLDIDARKKVNIAIDDMDREFKNNIYPVLTQNYGTEWSPGVDGETRITILIHPMIKQAAGYFYSGDEYLRSRVPDSNQREMVYLNSEHISENINKSFLAHEFTHLITFNQKSRLYGVNEETWLNEARAEYASTLLGYDKIYEASNLQKRVEQFLQSPQDSLTEWQGKAADYGVLNLFIQYLTEHYGAGILTDSLKTDRIGIVSLDYALAKNGFKKNFSQVFTDWSVAIFLNDCGVGPEYCYLNENLKNFRIAPYIYFLPTAGDSVLNVGYLTKEWAGNWQKIIGGKKSLKLEFTGAGKSSFRVPYIVEDSSGKQSVGFLPLDASQKGSIIVEDGKISSLTIIPMAQGKTAGFGSDEKSYQFSWSVASENSANGSPADDAELIAKLQAKIEELKAKVAFLQAQLAAISGQNISCKRFSANLYFGMTNNSQVSCLQQFLKSQGLEIYPEGIISGNFFNATKTAVIRFQEKYASEVLAPVGLTKGTGFLGNNTRAKINQLLNP